MSEPVLVGDIGGTNVRFALARRGFAGHPVVSDVSVMPGDDFESFDLALATYCKEVGHKKPEQALIAIAGPVEDGVVKLTNRDWTVDARRLADVCDLKRVQLVNDYAAMARAIPELPDSAFRVIHPGDAEDDGREPILVSGPGTGVGMATLIPVGRTGWRVLTGEGGHAAFAPYNEREWALYEKLLETHGYVSRELVLSGSGLNAVHQALCAIDGVEWTEIQPGDMLDLARQGDRICRDICEIRARGTLYALGDAALMNGTRGGVVITGGVAERLEEWLLAPEALERFMQRGPMSDYMPPISVRLLLAGEAALVGAAALYFDEGRDE
ncbi:glucokinase [Henriciella pelagia]|jgi:glucokinase|uniref:Glucokinase n=1 Tax=Henriciella pelagia TaxID=1977912 RepID=A0ABQ1JES9_9PROT|nr:glucokinase [Henriciella pelagia]GGB66741.1 glucokinase [Henriciella pelagia]